MVTGKTIQDLNVLEQLTTDVSIPVSKDGSTYRILYAQIDSNIQNQGIYTNAAGAFSHTEGSGTTANGSFSHAEGVNTSSNGLGSHSEGVNTISLGVNSHSEGFTTMSVGDTSHAEGATTNSIGIASHSEGILTSSFGDYSHSEGNQTKSYGSSSHAEGYSSTTFSNYSHAEGVGTNAGWRGYLVVYTTNNSVAIDTQGIDISSQFTSGYVVMDNKLYTYNNTFFDGTFFIIYLNEPLSYSNIEEISYTPMDTDGFGYVFSTPSDDVVVEVQLPLGVGQQFFNTSYGSVFVSSNGYFTFSGGSSECCFNQPDDIPTSVGFPGVYIGINNTDGLLYGISTGYTIDGLSFVIRVEGSYRDVPSEPANFIYNIVIPFSNGTTIDLIIESNPYGTGQSGVSDGVRPYYLAEFSGLSQSSYRIFTSVYNANFANDINNTSNISAPIANGVNTHSEGNGCKALGTGSHAEGYNTISVGQYSHSQGFKTIAVGNNQFALGVYNTTGNTDSLVVIGNGTGDTSRSDILIVNNHNVKVKEDLHVEGFLNIPNVMEFTDNDDALYNGLKVGSVYRTGDLLKIVH